VPPAYVSDDIVNIAADLSHKLSPMKQRALAAGNTKPSSGVPDSTLKFQPPARPPAPTGVGLSRPPSALSHGPATPGSALASGMSSPFGRPASPMRAGPLLPSRGPMSSGGGAVGIVGVGIARPASAASYAPGAFTRSQGFNIDRGLFKAGGTPLGPDLPPAGRRPSTPGVTVQVLQPVSGELAAAAAAEAAALAASDSTAAALLLGERPRPPVMPPHPFLQPVPPLPEPPEDPKAKKAPAKKAPPPKKGGKKGPPEPEPKPVVSLVGSMKAVVGSAALHSTWLAKPMYKARRALRPPCRCHLPPPAAAACRRHRGVHCPAAGVGRRRSRCT
jgi:hypothetical protein